jgi:hypothetical protein
MNYCPYRLTGMTESNTVTVSYFVLRVFSSSGVVTINCQLIYLKMVHQELKHRMT